MNEFLSQIPSFIVAGIGLYVMVLIGTRKRWAWIVAIFSEAIWVAYGVWRNQIGLVVISCLYAVVYFHNWRKCRDA